MNQKNPIIPADVLMHIEEHLENPLVLLDKYNNVLWANKKIQLIYPDLEPYGKNIIDLVHFFIKDEETLIQFLSGSYQDLKLHGPVLAYEVKKGLRLHYKNIVDNYKLFWLSATDNDFPVTEKVLDELDYKKIFHQVFDAIIIYNSEGTVIDVNTAVCELYNTNREQFIGKNIFSLFPHQTLSDANRIWKEFIKNKVIEGLYKFKLPNDEYRYIQFKARADFLGGHHLGILRDVTNSYIAERALKKSELQLRTVFNSSIYQILLLDKDYNIITFNNEAFGLIHQELALDFGIGKSIWEYFPESFKKECEEHTPDLLKGCSLTTEFCLSDDKQKEWYTASIVPALDDKNDLKFISLTLHNITERKNNEEELIKMNFELDSFVYRASHDLRAPLRSVLGLARLIDDEQNREEVHKYVQLTEKSIQKLDTFIADLTNFSRNSRLDVSRERIDFHKLVDEVMENLKFMDNASHVRVEREFEQGLEFHSDPMRLSVIFQNLLSNAYKYANKYRECSFLKINLKKEEDYLIIEFQDNGIGVKEAYIPQLFSMFFRASQNSYGSGLGLYITKQVVDKLQGSITVSSVYNEGTSFFIKLPYLQ